MPRTRCGRRSDRDIVQSPRIGDKSRISQILKGRAVGAAVPACAKACPFGENLAEVGHCGSRTTARRLFVFYNFGHGGDKMTEDELRRYRDCAHALAEVADPFIKRRLLDLALATRRRSTGRRSNRARSPTCQASVAESFARMISMSREAPCGRSIQDGLYALPRPNRRQGRAVEAGPALWPSD